MTSRTNYETDLAKAVAKSFREAGFTVTELLQGPVELTELPWQCPPLICTDPLDGFPLEDYLNYPVGFDAGQLGAFWQRGMKGLLDNPTSVVTMSGWRSIAPVLRGVSPGERALRFSVPESFPAPSAFSGHVFTMEVTHLLAHCGYIDSIVFDADNYYVTITGESFGIRNGEILHAPEWESIAGIVDSFATNGRGLENTTCRYDLLAKVRSVLHENAERFTEFTGLDWALQALGKLSQDRLCTSLRMALEQMLPDDVAAKRTLVILDEALDIMETWLAHDRVKLFSLHEVLVPDIYTEAAFSTHIYNLAEEEVPSVLPDKTLAKIKKNLWAKRITFFNSLSPRDRAAFERAPWTEPSSSD